MRKIAVITGTRAEFGLLKPLIDLIRKTDGCRLQLVVTAMHLSPEFGYTVSEIEKEGYRIDKKVECLLSSDTAVGISKSNGLATIGFADAFDELNPDLVFILGDRSEMLAAATVAMIANVPIAHIHGGETTEGAYDESIRHAITKMSYFHFAATEVYRKRIIQMGEDPKRVFNVGALGLDSIENLELLSREDFEESIGFRLGKQNVLITFHPVTLENGSAKDQFKEILNALDSLDETHFIFTYANSDKDGRIINQMIEEYVSANPKRTVSYKSLGQLLYFSALQFMDVVLGNSSSGIIEVPYFNIPTINVGDRQKGREIPESVLQVENREEAIKSALQQAFENSFKKSIKNQEQLYGDGNAAPQIMKTLGDSENIQLKKPFYNIHFQYEN